MIDLNFSVSVEKSCKSLVFKDITGFQSAGISGGYGGSNININEITKTILRITTPAGIEYEVFSTYVPTQGEWKIEAFAISDLQKIGSVAKVNEVTNDCGCPPIPQDFISSIPFQFPGDNIKYNNRDCDRPNQLNYFEDGCTTFTYEVYARTGIPIKTCQYAMSHKLCDNQSVWAKRNGGWYNITNLGTLNNMNFSYVIASTIDVFTNWEVRDEQGVAAKGLFTKFNCTDSEETTSAMVDIMVSAKTITFPFTCNLDNLLSRIAFELTVGHDCDTLKAGISEKKAIELFSVARAKILAVKNGSTVCGCDCIMSSIQSSTNMLTAVIREEKLSIESC